MNIKRRRKIENHQTIRSRGSLHGYTSSNFIKKILGEKIWN